MIRLGVVVPNAADATSWYRGAGPLAEMAKLNPSIDLHFLSQVSWASVKPLHAVFFQRPYKTDHLTAIKVCKMAKIPVWVDYDDLIFAVPHDNPAYEVYMKKETQATIVEILRLADLVTVSTRELKKSFQLKKTQLSNNVHVVNNAFDFRTFKREPKASGRKLITWRGSRTHQKDLSVFAGEIIELAEADPSWSWAFMGYNPWFITEHISDRQAVVTESIDPLEFMEVLLPETGPSIHIVPLSDSSFNRCKSNIAWMEATYAGAVVLAPDWEEWRQPGVVTYDSPDSFKQALLALQRGGFKEWTFGDLHKMSWNHIKVSFALEAKAIERNRLLHSLVTAGEWPKGGERIEDEGVELE